MRPVAPSRHVLAALIFVLISAAVGYFALIDPRISDPQVNIACAALKDHQPSLYAGDPIFGKSNLWQFHTPIFQGVLKFVMVPDQYRDPILPFRLLAGLSTLIFLGGMYGLLYRQTRSWSISAFVAVMSSTVTYVLGNSNWGIGPLETITPPTIFLATVPLIVLAYLNYEKQWRVMLVFLFIGLMGNLHLVTAMNLTCILLLVYLARQRMALRAWVIAVGCGLCALVAAGPYILYYVAVRAGMAGGEGWVTTELVEQAFQLVNQHVLYLSLLKPLLSWSLLLPLAVLGVVAISVLSRWERFRLRDGSFWVYMLIAVAIVALGFQGISQLIGVLFGGIPPAIDFVRASNLLLLPLYVLFAQGLTNLFRLVRSNRHMLRWICAGLMVAWIMPSDNFRIVRHKMYAMAGSFLKEPDRPQRWRNIDELAQRESELAAIAAWAREPGVAGVEGEPTSRAPGLFITDRSEFRMLSRQSILAGPDDVRYIYYLTPWRLREWVTLYAQQQRLLSGNASQAEMREFFLHLRSSPAMREILQWYVILDSSVSWEKYPALEPVEGEGWGRHYRLYRVQVDKLATTSTSQMIDGRL